MPALYLSYYDRIEQVLVEIQEVPGDWQFGVARFRYTKLIEMGVLLYLKIIVIGDRI